MRFVLDRVTLGQVFSILVLLFSPVSIIPLMLHTDAFTCRRLYVILAVNSIVK